MADEENAEASGPGEKTEDVDPNREGLIAALWRERAGYEVRELKGRVAEVDVELKRLGVAQPKPASAPREAAVESKPRRTAGRAKQGE
jgi:hypothetical protein